MKKLLKTYNIYLATNLADAKPHPKAVQHLPKGSTLKMQIMAKRQITITIKLV